MKHAIVRQRRTLRDGRQLVNIVCPICDHRHWIPADANVGDCPTQPDRLDTTP